jgi:two-component system NtrC family response regulator
VRELEHRIQRAVVLSGGRVIRADDLELEPEGEGALVPLRAARETAERRVVIEALRRNCGNIARAARDLEISRPTLHDLLRKFDIVAVDYKNGMGPNREGAGK